MSIRKKIKLEFCGWQMLLDGSYMPLWNLLEPLGDHSVGSTVSSGTLNSHSISIPDPFRMKPRERFIPLEF